MDTSNADIMHRLEIAGSDTSAFVPEKRPTFTFHRRIRDDPAFAVELPCSPLLHYAAVVKSAGGAIRDLVQEWTEEWLAGVGTRGGADTESRLRGMVEEVVWGHVIWYGIGGWASRGGVCGRGINADFFLYVSCMANQAGTELTSHSKRAPRHLSHLPPSDHPPGRIVIQQRAWPLVRQSPLTAPDVPLRIRGSVHHAWEARAAHRRVLRGDRLGAVIVIRRR